MTESVTADSIEAQIERFFGGVRELSAAVDTLSPDAFLGPLGNWSPRDIVAHLIGWNRYAVLGAEQLLKGELPFYDKDPGEDYCNVNASLVAEYPSENRTELLAEHEKAASELALFLRSLSPQEWGRDSGVEFDGEALSIRETVDEIIEDHLYHSAQIRDWAAGK